MTALSRPDIRPANPNFSSGPCAKRPGWTPDFLAGAVLGRSHRSKPGKAKLGEAIELTREILEVPDDYRIAIVPASDTGAMEMAMWSLLGARGVDMVAWESFGAGWVSDVVKQLKIDDVRRVEAPYGELPDLSLINFDHDVVFTWNGTTSGVRVPDGNFIPSDRKGLTLCDATSAVFAQKLDFTKLDVVTFSWQKVLGGEAAHGMLILSPRAVHRLETYTPDWPLPKIFRLTKSGELIEDLFSGATINTPSMLCVEDYLDTLKWARSHGGLTWLMARADANFQIVDTFVCSSSWLGHLAVDPATRSNTSVCLSIIDPQIVSWPAEKQAGFVKELTTLLEMEGVAYDIASYRDAPPGLRLWTGATVEPTNLQALMPWLDWAYRSAKQS